MNYIKSVGKEMKQVNWPSIKEVNRFTWIAIIFVVVFGLYFTLTDGVFSSIMDWLFSI